jgi:uncharacterized protein (DUF427 family)
MQGRREERGRALEILPGSVEVGAKRVRGFSAGVLVVESFSPLLVWERPAFPRYFFAASELQGELRPAGSGDPSPSLGPCELYEVAIGDRVLREAARRYPHAPQELAHEAYTLVWSALDTWLEEDEVVYSHPRSPYVRIDALVSSRHVRAVVAGEVVADCRRPVVLFETGLPPRFYLPRVDVRMDLLNPTDTHTDCPYKGTATYWSVVVGDLELPDVVWSYPTPLPESAKIAGLLAFWPERSPELELYVDGERVGGP